MKVAFARFRTAGHLLMAAVVLAACGNERTIPTLPLGRTICPVDHRLVRVSSYLCHAL